MTAAVLRGASASPTRRTVSRSRRSARNSASSGVRVVASTSVSISRSPTSPLHSCLTASVAAVEALGRRLRREHDAEPVEARVGPRQLPGDRELAADHQVGRDDLDRACRPRRAARPARSATRRRSRRRSPRARRGSWGRPAPCAQAVARSSTLSSSAPGQLLALRPERAEPGAVPGRAGGRDHDVGVAQRLGGGRRPQRHVHAEPLERPAEVVDRSLPATAMRHPANQPQVPAELVAGLVERDRVPTLGGHGGDLHAGRAAADDGDPPRPASPAAASRGPSGARGP